MVNDTRNELGWIVDGYKAVLGTPETCMYGDIGGSVGHRFAQMERELLQIKEVLLELQMTLRTMGLDDMSNRLGDINLLLT